ncbi:major capsid protein [Blackfly microvirus SF02]|uniref:Major capsid protein n=1 Tax=Blackfly microvirus SF02 TaxID=2576452 RepID=A0A4P8PLZ5_9VIRU|nr:major capsid protein [Blackfly microvirus SF02]
MPSNYGPLSQSNQRVNVDHFSMVPRADIPRSTFTTQHTHKTTFDGGYLVPIFVGEALPGDSFSANMTVFARMNTLLFPLMDHITLETFGFFVPNRLLWLNWKRFMGEQDTPGASISYLIPQVTGPAGGWKIASLGDYFGLPTVGQCTPGVAIATNALPLRAYQLIYNEWFRDENLVPPATFNYFSDGPDSANDYGMRRRAKRHDYFTSALPWPLKDNSAVNIPLSGTAPVKGLGLVGFPVPTGPYASVAESGVYPGTVTYTGGTLTNTASVVVRQSAIHNGYPDVYADLTQASGATIAALRLAVQTQRFLERDARSGTRYTELLRAHFGVMPEDARLQRPEYIGGGRSAVQTSAIPQTSATGVSGGSSPLAALGGASTITGQHTFRYNAAEHGYIIILAHVDAELTYQQGLHRMWSRNTRFDFYFPVFAHLSEQAILNKEIYVDGTSADDQIFGYQERWAEYRHYPSRISGLFRSTGSGTMPDTTPVIPIDAWHSAQRFGAIPTLNSTFIESAPPFGRNLAAGALASGQQFLCDMLFTVSHTRAMPMYSVPGNMDRF